MRRRLAGILTAIVLAAVAVIYAGIPVAALDTKYTFDEFEMSLKIPKSYTVITRDSERTDEAFEQHSLDYDETMTAFNAAQIYLQAYAPENAYRITLTVSSDDNSKSINNYSELTSAQREEVLRQLTTDPMCTGGVEIKHGGNICFDLALTGEVNAQTVYINQSNTVVNGLNINLTLQKTDEEIFAEEAKQLTDIVKTLSFDRIRLNSTGPSFEWWRILLWLVLLVAVSAVISFLYKQHNESNKRKLEQRRQQRIQRRVSVSESVDGSAKNQEIKDGQTPEEAPKQPSFDEVLGYESSDDFLSRASTDLESYDISVRGRNTQKGMSYFEDEGDGIDDGSDYFENYFKEHTPERSSAQRAADTVGAYLRIAFTHLGYFFKNLGKMIAKIFEGNKTKN